MTPTSSVPITSSLAPTRRSSPSRCRCRNLLGRRSRALAANSDLKLQLYYDRTHRRIPGSFTQNIDTYDLDFQHRRPLGPRHDLVWGLGYRTIRDAIINTPQNAFLPPRVHRH